jgi:hypothetical protein
VAVYGKSASSADSVVVIYTKHGSTWRRERGWAAHNGKRGWTTDHHEDEKKSPVGVFTLSDAGGVLADPGSKLPYHRSASFTAPRSWARSHWHDFDLVIAIDYNRVRGTAPNDPTRPEGEAKGGAPGSTWTTAAVPRPASASPGPTWSTCCGPWSRPCIR